VRKARNLEAALPWLYLKVISTGEMHSALSVLVGTDAQGLSASTVARLKTQWGQQYQAWCTRQSNRGICGFMGSTAAYAPRIPSCAHWW